MSVEDSFDLVHVLLSLHSPTCFLLLLVDDRCPDPHLFTAAAPSSTDSHRTEIKTLGRIRHRNIVRLFGYVSNKDTNLLLYEYMPNGSLGELLHETKGGHLQWERRYRIAVEAAKGLCYLHHDCLPLIIHRGFTITGC